MWISKEKFQNLEKRIADLEFTLQGQLYKTKECKPRYNLTLDRNAPVESSEKVKQWVKEALHDFAVRN